jgi:hypothetical protein
LTLTARASAIARRSLLNAKKRKLVRTKQLIEFIQLQQQYLMRQTQDISSVTRRACLRRGLRRPARKSPNVKKCFPTIFYWTHLRAATDLKETNMLKTMTALSLGFLLAGTAASNAGEPSQKLMHKLHAHRAVHHHIVDPRAHKGAPELKMGVPFGATSLVSEPNAADPPVSKGCLWGLNRYNGVSCP